LTTVVDHGDPFMFASMTSPRLAQCGQLDWPPPPDWNEWLQRDGVLRIRGVPLDGDNRSLRTLAATLGSTSMRALPRRAGLVEAAGVQRVEALAIESLDQFGKPLLSASGAAFPLHTDESFCDDPAHWLLLHCWRSAPVGGVSLFADVQEVLRHAERSLRIALEQMRLPYPGGDRVTLDIHGRVRFNALECLASGRQSPAAALWLPRLIKAFALAAQELRLDSGDLLLIDNWRVLHGRSAFAADSGRLLKRMRVL
jgi:alpha-ketoglutarate-dependent taurine dioxygenase